ncbi:MAG: iron ABC transporter substrate-binding protein [Acidimicrobiia bacterium]
MRRPVLAAALALVVAACGGVTGGETTTTTSTDTHTTAAETTTTAASTDRRLIVYSGRSEELMAPIYAQFEEATGIDVEVRYAGSGELATTLLQEGAQSPADVFYSQDPAFAGAVALAGLFQELPDDILSLVPARFSDEEGRWVGVTARNRVFVYNPGLVGEDELPADIWALTDPTWNGRIGVAPTNGSFVAFVAGMLLAEGEDRTLEWLRGIAANAPVIFDGNSPIVAAVDAGDIDAGLVNHYYLLRIEAEQGEATASNHFFQTGDPGALVLPTGAGVLATAANPDEALEFIRFLLSEEAQAFFLDEVLEYPLVEGIGTPPGQMPLADLPTPEISLSELATVLDRATELISEAGLT